MIESDGSSNSSGLQFGVISYTTINCSSGQHEGNHTDSVLDAIGGPEIADIVIHLLGFMGNVLSLLVLIRRRIGGPEMCRLLLLLSIAEVLYTLLSFLPETVELFSRHETRLWLKIFCKVAGHTFLSLRNWWIAAIGCARFFVIWKPLKMKRINIYKPTGITIVFFVFLVVWLMESIALTYAFKVRVRKCSQSHVTLIDVWFMHDDSNSLKILEGLALFLRTVLPVVLVSIFSYLTVRQIGLSLELQNKAANGGSFKKNKNNRYSSATKTILGLTVAFALFELPLAFTFIFCFLNIPQGSTLASALEVYHVVSELLVSLDSLCNFFIYCLSSKIYRDELRHIICCRRRRSLTRELTQTDAPGHRFTRGRLRNRLTVGEIDRRKTSDSSNIICNSNCHYGDESEVGRIHLEEDDTY